MIETLAGGFFSQMPPRQGVSTRVAIVILRSIWWSLNFLEDRAFRALDASWQCCDRSAVVFRARSML
jgi:hypothetical protein